MKDIIYLEEINKNYKSFKNFIQIQYISINLFRKRKS